jgi:hypothetical protein
MKKYSFPLDRVLDWKTVVAEREQITLQTLQQRQEALTESLLNLSDRIDDLSRDAHTADSGHDLAYTAQARSVLLRQKMRTEQEHATGETLIASQQVKYRAAEIQRKLIDKLKGRSYEEWSAELARETDATAADLYLSAWNRRE